MFVNRIRLPFKITRPQFPEERNVFRKANGQAVTLSVIIRKTYQGETDFLAEDFHQRLKIALAHDNVSIEGDRYLGGVVQDGDYQIDWPDFKDYPTAKASFQVQVTPFDATNANCQTCDEATQLDLADDTFPSPLDEDTAYTIVVTDNDAICCYPATLSLISYNSDYLSSASLDPDGTLHVHTGIPINIANGILLATYRVTCPNGGYDEANVYGNINGSLDACLAPTDLAVSLGVTSLAFTWVDGGSPAISYSWEIYLASDLVTPVQTGSTSSLGVTITGLTSSTDYVFKVKSVCSGGESNFVSLDATTNFEPDEDLCGPYKLVFNDGTGIPGNGTTITYLGCDGTYKNVFVPNAVSRGICAMQTAPGTPVYISSHPNVTLSYPDTVECDG